MKHLPRMVLVAVALLALSGVAASSAVAAETLKFVPTSGKFPEKVKGKTSAVTFNEEGTSYGCEATTAEGEITGAKTATLKLKMTNCKISVGQGCNSTGAKSEEIVTQTVPVELVYTSKSKHEAALDLNYQEGHGRKSFASWTCAGTFGETLGIRGQMLAPVTPVNSATLTHTATLAHETGGERQTPATYETEAGTKVLGAYPELDILGTFWSELASVVSKLELTTTAAEGTLEIKA